MELEQEHPLSCLKRFLKVNPSRVRKQILTSFQQEMLLISLPRSCILRLKCVVKVLFHKSCKLASSEKDIIININNDNYHDTHRLTRNLSPSSTRWSRQVCWSGRTSPWRGPAPVLRTNPCRVPPIYEVLLDPLLLMKSKTTEVSVKCTDINTTGVWHTELSELFFPALARTCSNIWSGWGHYFGQWELPGMPSGPIVWW